MDFEAKAREIMRLRKRLARLEHRATVVVMSNEMGNREDVPGLNDLASELLSGSPIDCPYCGADGSQAHRDGCEVTRLTEGAEG